MNVLVSSCFLLNTRYDQKDQQTDAIKELIQHLVNCNFVVIPACPEQLGGMSTPRIPAEICGTRVVNKENVDVSYAFEFGASQILKLHNIYKFDIAILKDGSPSCGSSYVYDGSFTKTKIEGVGVTASVLKKVGVKVFNEKQVVEIKDYIKSQAKM